METKIITKTSVINTPPISLKINKLKNIKIEVIRTKYKNAFITYELRYSETTIFLFELFSLKKIFFKLILPKA